MDPITKFLTTSYRRFYYQLLSTRSTLYVKQGSCGSVEINRASEKALSGLRVGTPSRKQAVLTPRHDDGSGEPN